MWRKKEEAEISSNLNISSSNQAREQIEAYREYLYFLQDHLPDNPNIKTWINNFDKLLSDSQGVTYHDLIKGIRNFNNQFLTFNVITEEENKKIAGISRVISSHTKDKILSILLDELNRVFEKYGKKEVTQKKVRSTTIEDNKINIERAKPLHALIDKLIKDKNGKYSDEFTADELYKELIKLKSERTSTGKSLGKITQGSKNSFLLSSEGTRNFDKAITLVGYAKKGIIERLLDNMLDAAKVIKAAISHKK